MTWQRRAAAGAAAVVAALAWSACGDEDRSGEVLVRVPGAAAMAPLPDGGLLYGERLSGTIRRVEPSRESATVAQVDVSTNGQRGLLGVAVAANGAVYAAWTDPTRRLVVAQVAPGPTRTVWTLARTSRLANGGRLAFAHDGRLLIGIGDLQQPELIDDPTSPNGKLLALDPRRGPDQQPAVVSSGWNNPFAFAVATDGAVWVADNAPGDEPERLQRADPPGPATELPPTTAPSGLAVTADDDLLVCGYVSEDLLQYRVAGSRAVAAGRRADDCRLGVVVLADGRIAYATDDAIRVLPPPDGANS